jgi:LytS/YehU family sensor histidine kinase
VDKALKFVDDLAVILRLSLENASLDFIPLEEEIEFLKTYAEIEQLRYGEKLDVRFVNELENRKLLIPPMLIQPLIENAVKHGIAGLKGRGTVTVRFFDDNGVFTISVKDNGVGREAGNSVKAGAHTGKALSIIRERLALLNQKNNTDIHGIRFIDLMEDGKPKGTEVVITLMFYEQEDKEA